MDQIQSFFPAVRIQYTVILFFQDLSYKGLNIFSSSIINTVNLGIVCVLLFFWKGKGEFGSFIQIGSVDHAVVSMNDRPADRQSDADSFVSVSGIRAVLSVKIKESGRDPVRFHSPGLQM